MPGGASAIASNQAGFDHESAKRGLRDLARSMHPSGPDLLQRARYLDAGPMHPDRATIASKGSTP
jgi:hypothetical protein